MHENKKYTANLTGKLSTVEHNLTRTFIYIFYFADLAFNETAESYNFNKTA